jgi:hypothetical protein
MDCVEVMLALGSFSDAISLQEAIATGAPVAKITAMIALRTRFLAIPRINRFRLVTLIPPLVNSEKNN